MFVPPPPRRSPLATFSGSRRRIVTVMVIFSVLIVGLLAMIETAETGVSGERGLKVTGVKKTNVPGFFMQDLEGTNDTTFDYIASNFGLLDAFDIAGLDERDLGVTELGERGDERRGDDEEANKASWARFEKAIERLNKKAPRNTAYKVLYLARHGQGYHNVAESFYGTPLWDCYWSLQDGNGTSRWDDAELTNIGIGEAQKANLAFKDQIKAKFPLPDVYYSSPLSRASSTLQIHWGDITLSGHKAPRPIFKEKLRETIGIHTCDRRNTKSYLEKKYPSFTFEKGFTESDKLWYPMSREPNDARDIRLGAALDEIFADRKDATYISITSHSGAIQSILQAIGHRSFGLKTGGVIPVVVKVEYVGETPATTSVSPSGTAPVCTVDPTATS